MTSGRVAHRLVLLAALFGALLIVLIALPPSRERLPPLTIYSAEPSGGRALWLWLGALGYAASTLERAPYRVPEGTATVLVLAPTRGFGGDELDELERWVRGGGTLVVAADGLVGGTLLGRFGLGLRALPGAAETAVPRGGPGNRAPLDPSIQEVTVRAAEELVLDVPEAASFLGDGERTFGALVPLDAGRVLALSAPSALSNEALRRPDNARLALSLVGPAAGGAVAVDELHHGFGVPQPRSLTALLTDRAWGRAALYAALLVVVYLGLRGRRFGRPRPILVDRGRSLAEYVTSLAALYRAGGKRAWVAEHFRRRLRRDVARDLGLPSDATDEQLADRSRALGRDPAAMLGVLGRLERGGLGEAELITLVRDGEQARASVGARLASP